MMHVLPAVSMAVVLLAQLMPTDLCKLVTEVGALGILGFYVYWVNTKTLPNLTTAYREEAREAREHSDAQLDRVITALQRPSAPPNHPNGDTSQLS